MNALTFLTVVPMSFSSNNLLKPAQIQQGQWHVRHLLGAEHETSWNSLQQWKMCKRIERQLHHFALSVKTFWREQQLSSDRTGKHSAAQSYRQYHCHGTRFHRPAAFYLRWISVTSCDPILVWGCFLTARLSSSRAQAPLILEGRRGKVPFEKNQFENMFKLFKPVFLCFCRKIALLGLYKNYKISKAFASWCFVC